MVLVAGIAVHVMPCHDCGIYSKHLCRGDWGPLGHFLDFVKYLDSDKQYAYITYHN